MTKVGRPATYRPDAMVVLTADNAQSKLQRGGERRAIVNALIDNQGRMTIAELDEHFGFDTKLRVMALAHAGWVTIEQEA